MKAVRNASQQISVSVLMSEFMPLALGKGFVFAAVVAIASYAVILSTLIGGVIWSDFLNVNAHRSHANALFIIAIMSPLVAAVAFIMVASLPATAAALCASLAEIVFRRVPLWLLPILASACTLTLYLQLFLVGPWFDVSAEYGPAHHQQTPSLHNLVVRNIFIAAFYFVPLAFAWKKTERRTLSQSLHLLTHRVIFDS